MFEIMFRKIFTIILLCHSLNSTRANCGMKNIFQNPCFTDQTESPVNRENYIVNKIIIKGNKITKTQIIFRELLFSENDTITSEKLPEVLEQSRKNLLNTSLFNFVTIDTSTAETGKINISIDVIERWYIWPLPFFQLTDRNFNVWWETKDLSKADYGINLTWDNFRGRKESVVFLLRMGYDESFGIAYKIPYINKGKTLGIGINGGFSGNHEAPYITYENKQAFYKNTESYVRKNISGNVSLTLRRNIFNTHIFQVNFNDFRFADILINLNPGFARQNHIRYFSLYYYFKSDHRDIKAYPLKGYFLDLEFAKHGLGLMNDEKVDMTYIHTSARRYWNLYKRWYFAADIKTKLSPDKSHPYFLERGLGYGNDFVRGYEYYVAGGQNFFLLKSNFKFEIVKTRVKEMKFIPTKKFSKFYYAFYLNLFADGAYVNNRSASANNTLSNKALFGTGVGIDFVTYYDKVMRIEYSINKMGEKGVFLHFVSPI